MKIEISITSEIPKGLESKVVMGRIRLELVRQLKELRKEGAIHGKVSLCWKSHDDKVFSKLTPWEAGELELYLGDQEEKEEA